MQQDKIPNLQALLDTRKSKQIMKIHKPGGKMKRSVRMERDIDKGALPPQIVELPGANLGDIATTTTVFHVPTNTPEAATKTELTATAAENQPEGHRHDPLSQRDTAAIITTTTTAKGIRPTGWETKGICMIGIISLIIGKSIEILLNILSFFF